MKKTLKTKASKLFKCPPPTDTPIPAIPDDELHYNGGIESDGEDRIVSNIRLGPKMPVKKPSRFALRSKASRVFSGKHAQKSTTFGGAAPGAVEPDPTRFGPPPPRPPRPEQLDGDLVGFMRRCDMRLVLPVMMNKDIPDDGSVAESATACVATPATTSEVDVNDCANKDVFADQDDYEAIYKESDSPSNTFTFPEATTPTTPTTPSTSNFPDFHSAPPFASAPAPDGRDSHPLAEYYRTARSSTNCSLTPSMSISLRFNPSLPASTTSLASLMPPPVPHIPALDSLTGSGSQDSSRMSGKSRKSKMSMSRKSKPSSMAPAATMSHASDTSGPTPAIPSVPVTSALLASAPASARSHAESTSTTSHPPSSVQSSIQSPRNSSASISLSAGRTGFPLSYVEAVDRLSSLSGHQGKMVMECRGKDDDTNWPVYNFIKYSDGQYGNRRGMTFRDADGFYHFVEDV